MRLFVAVYPSPPVVADLAGCVAGLALGAPQPPGHSLRLVPPERWHLTLAFLGEVAERREPAVRVALAAAVQRWLPADGDRQPPRLWLGGGGRFGRGRFTTVWTGVRGDVAALGDLAAAVRKELRTAKIAFDGKAFRPHLTLARPGDRLTAADLGADLAALEQYQGPEWTVDAVELVRSHPGPKLHYERLAAFPLAVSPHP